MKKSLWLLSALAVLGFAAMGCESDEDAVECGDTLCGDLLSLTLDKPYCVQSNTGKMVCSQYDACCEDLEAECDRVFDDKGDCVSAVRNYECDNDNGCEEGEVCDMQLHECVPEDVAEETFTFVRIDDASEVKDATWDQEANSGKGCFKTDKGACVDDPGADIDAIILQKHADNGGGDLIYATDVIEYVFGGHMMYQKGDAAPTTKVATNPLMALKEPDSLVSYGTDDVSCKLYIDEDTSCFGNSSKQCNDRPFVSLGGTGGYLIVQMGGDIEAKDTLSVLEVGDCKMIQCNDSQDGKCSSTGKAIADDITIYVSMTDTKSDGWKMVGQKGKVSKGMVSFEITDSILNGADATGL